MQNVIMCRSKYNAIMVAENTAGLQFYKVLLSFCIVKLCTIDVKLYCEKDENKQKEAELGPIFKKQV